MSNKVSSVFSIVFVGAVICLVVFVLVYGMWLFQGESPDQAYGRGYRDAHWLVKYDIETNPTVVVDNLGRTWYRIDSIDTLPAVDSVDTMLQIHPDVQIVDSSFLRNYQYALPTPYWESDIVNPTVIFVPAVDSVDTIR